MRLWNGKYLVVRRDGTVPAWPAFVLGARDPAAPAALMAYAEAMLEQAKKARAEPDKEYIQSIMDMAAEFETYAHNEGAGDPSAPPHRKEADDVMAALRGETTVMVVFPDKDNTKTKPPKD